MNAQEIMLLARPGEILTSAEMGRLPDFLALFEECLERLADDANAPMRSEIVAARAEAAMIWGYDRETSDGNYIRQLAEANKDLRGARQEFFASMEHQYRGRELILQALEQNSGFLDAVRSACAGDTADIVPFRRRKKA